MTRAYFVSDVHLVAEDDARGRLFLDLLRRIDEDEVATHVFLLGDIFDLWLADHDYFLERFPAVVAALEKLQARGLELHYFEGNHDLHLERFWGRRLGMRVHPGPVHTELAGRRVRLEHGDQMDPDDRGYLFLRWFLRTPPIRFLLLHLPGSLIARIGERASAHSRDYTSNRKTISPSGAASKIRAHAAQAHAERPFDLILSGHVHVRDDHRFETAGGEARSVNLGSWFDRPCAFLLDERGGRFIELEPGDVAECAAPAPADTEHPA